MAHNGVIDAKNAIEFSNVSGIGMEIDESVVTVGQTVDLVSEFALAPVVDVVNRTLALGDRGLNTLHNSGTGFFVDRRSDKKQQFISLHQLTSFGL